jgi:predicted O-linked N-acetylglucosamine transferase (SPINDLY family)
MASLSAQETLAIALSEHQQGHLSHAGKLYRQILTETPDHADALHLLGILQQEEGHLEEAEALIQKAILATEQNRTPVPEFYNSLGSLYLDAAREEQTLKAIALFQKALQSQPNHPEFILNLGIAHFQLSQFEEARDYFLQAKALNPESPYPLIHLGNTYRGLANPDASEEAYQQALILDKTCVDGWYNLGNFYRESLAFEKAKRSYQAVLSIQPNHLPSVINLGVVFNQLHQYEETLRLYAPYLAEFGKSSVEIWTNMANAYRGLNQLDKAFKCYEQALFIKPDYEGGWYNLGNCYRAENQFEQAIAAYQKALEHRNNEYAEVHVALGTIYFMKDQLHQAISYLKEGLKQNPHLIEAYDILGLCLNRLNRAEETISFYQQAYEITQHPRYLIKQITATPCIYASSQEKAKWRAYSLSTLEHVLNTIPRPVLLDNPVLDIGSTNFYQAYHGENELEFQKLYAQLFSNLPRYHFKHYPQNQKIKLGFISRLLRPHHTIGELNQGFLDHLDRTRFEVVLIRIEDPSARQDPMRLQPDDIEIWIPEAELDKAAEQILDQQLDALFYTDIGMDPTTYFLAMSRLAPVQFATWGHPITSGIETMDYFLSWKQAEILEAQEHYSEKLVLLDHYTSYFYRPQLPENPKTRTDFGFQETSNLYLCTQTLFKIQPDFDQILAGILKKDPNAEIGFIHLKYPDLAEDLLNRWKKTIPDGVNRIRFVPRMSNEDFTVFQTLADVLLDPTHFTGGTTSIEAFAFGVPIVTLPSPYLKARWTVAFYEVMGITDCVANTPEEYIDIAVQIGTQKNYRQQLTERILATVNPLFENKAIIDEFEAFVIQAVQDAKLSHQTTQEGSL